MGKNSDPLDDLIRLLRTLPEEEIAAVRVFVEGLVQRETTVKEALASYIVSAEAAENAGPQLPLSRGSREALLECIGLWKFEPGELDEILADLEESRLMELEEDYSVSWMGLR